MDDMDLCNVQYSNYSFTCLEMDNSRENIEKIFVPLGSKRWRIIFKLQFSGKKQNIWKNDWQACETAEALSRLDAVHQIGAKGPLWNVV